MFEVNTDLGPVPIMVREQLPDGAVVCSTDNGDGTISIVYSDIDGNAVEIGRLDYRQMVQDWMECGDCLHSYRKEFPR